MIIRQATTVFFNPVAEYKERMDFEANNPDFRMIAESTTTVAYEKVEYFSIATQHTECVGDALDALDEAEPEDTYCIEENCPIYQRDLSCERCNR